MGEHRRQSERRKPYGISGEFEPEYSKSRQRTYLCGNRKEVIDLTLGTNKIANLVTGMYLMKCLFQTTDTFAFK
jgi:hypothetical protein